MDSNSRFYTEVFPLKDKLFRLALRITFSREDAEDVVQETMVRLWRMTREGTPIDSIDALASTICRNLSLDLISRSDHQLRVPLDTDALHSSLPPSGLPLAPDPSLQLERDERRDALHRLIDTLPEKQRTALLLRDVEGHSYREIADIMQIGESDVKVNIFRARNKLKDLLTKRK